MVFGITARSTASRSMSADWHPVDDLFGDRDEPVSSCLERVVPKLPGSGRRIDEPGLQHAGYRDAAVVLREQRPAVAVRAIEPADPLLAGEVDDHREQHSAAPDAVAADVVSVWAEAVDERCPLLSSCSVMKVAAAAAEGCPERSARNAVLS